MIAQKISNPPSVPLAGLTATIEAAGHPLNIGNDGWWTDDAAAVEAIINAYAGSAAQLQYAQQQQLAALEAQYNSLVAANRQVVLSGTTYTLSLSPDALQHFDSEALAASILLNNTPGAPAWNANDYWVAADGVTKVPMPTAAQALSTAINLRAYVKAIIQNSQALTAAIGAATTVAEVNAVNITLGWPSNP